MFSKMYTFLDIFYFDFILKKFALLAGFMGRS